MRFDIPKLDPDQLDHVVFYETDSQFYEVVRRLLYEVPTRVNFDGSTLEIMTLSFEHEALKRFIGRLVEVIIEEFDIDAVPGGSTTMKLSGHGKGLEADECYWIQNEAAVRDVKSLDLSIHPPPDLVLEIDITHAVVDREAIYAAMRVPEMWHYDHQSKLTGWELVEGNWTRVEHSRAFPMIRLNDINPFIEKRTSVGTTTLIKDFRKWLRSLPR